MLKSKLIIILCLLLNSSLFGQFGNEWINYDQNYYKFKITRDGFYRITREQLQAAGFPVSNVLASRIQLFREGREIALNIDANQDNTVNYIEFYGISKDGTSDSTLYLSGTQPHTYYNLFSDESSYFLTYLLGNENGKRMSFSSDQNTTGLTPEAYHLADTLTVFTSDYEGGVQLSGNRMLSDYNAGEGWTGAAFSKNQSRSFGYNLTGLSSDGNTSIETVLSGRNGLGHNTVISVGPSTSELSNLSNIEFQERNSQFFTSVIPESGIGTNGELVVRVLEEGFPNAASRISIAYLRISYPQDLSMFGESNKVFSLDNISSRKAWLQIATTNATEIRAFDITDPYNAVRLSATPFTDRLEVVVSDVINSNKIVAVSAPSSVGTINQVSLMPYDLINKDYVIISHANLRVGEDPIQAYANYRESDAGGNYTVEIVDVEDLYEQFSYGDPTPLAITNFLRYASTQTSLAHVFIIGKGFTVDQDFYRENQSGLNIPTYGFPGTDAMYVLGIGTEPEIPGIPVGRLTATSPNQVSAYLSKIMEMESLAFDNLFRKDVLQLSGGLTQAEINAFANIVRNLAETAEGDFLGGRTFNTGKQSSQTVEFIDITDRVNEGVGFITFFGHSSGTVADIEVGRVSDPAFGFNNQGKYPIFLVNGCDAGGIFESNELTYGEDWVLEPGLGAINFIAHTDAAFSSTLRRWSELYYNIGFADSTFINKTVGEVIIETGRRYWEIGNSDGDLTQIRQMQLQGDPAYQIFGAGLPDYEINDNSILTQPINGADVLASQAAFNLGLVVTNFGRTTADSLLIEVIRTFPDGSSRTYLQQFQRPLRKDTIEFSIVLDPLDGNEGVNTFVVNLDPLNDQEELNEANNTANHEVTIFSGSTFNLFPIDEGVLSGQEVAFVWQSSSLLENIRNYDLEYDTSKDFNSPNRRLISTSGEILLTETIDFSTISLPDTAVIYWRTRFSDPGPNESDKWVESSFTIINNATHSWGQFNPLQLGSGVTEGIVFNESTNSWEFVTSSTEIDFFTYGGDDQYTLADLKVLVGGIDLLISSFSEEISCFENTFNVIVFDRETGNPYNPILTREQDVLSGSVCGRIPQRIYQFVGSDLVASLNNPRSDNILFTELIDAMNVGDQVVMFNIDSVGYSSWEPQVITAMNLLGVNTAEISSLTDGNPSIIFGRKGDNPGSATVITGNETASLQDNVIARFTSGSIRSNRVGPARGWESFFYDLKDDLNDNVTLSVLGIDINGQQNQLVTRSNTEVVDVSTIDAIQYPQLELSMTFNDEIDETPPQLNFWQVAYTAPPEGILLANDKESISKAAEGEELSRSFSYVNISGQPFSDSLSVMAALVNQRTGNRVENSFRINPPGSGDTTSFDLNFSTFNMAGTNSIVVEISPNENEAYNINNRITLNNRVEVQADETNPIIDVTFDGFHILDGDVVSPNPTISVRMRDDNEFLFKQDTSGFNLSLKLPGEMSQFQRINFSDPRLTYVPAAESQDFEIEFKPGPLEDGRYTLRVAAEDESGNAIRASDDPYEVNFEVINESAVTHFYPYPNPFSTNCRFVFTLTGSVIPDQLKIQIMTVSGRVVREITQDEIGPIRIGNNITSYAWDGRDEYGDQLSNGVYFYKVFIKSNGNDLERRSTNADRAFKNEFGKLYILR